MKENKKLFSRANLELVLLSAISLYVELLIIRWLSADIRAFTVFRTFPLIASFVGLGVGFALRNDKYYRYLPLSILLLAISIKLADFRGISFLAFPTLSVFQWANLAGGHRIEIGYVLVLMLVVMLFLGISFGICVCIGSRLGILFSGCSPLKA